jgi:hypothetical protein
MADPLDDYLRLRREVETLQRDADRAQGALEQALRDLAAEDCASVKIAERKLKKLDDEVAGLEEKLAEKTDAVREALEAAR